MHIDSSTITTIGIDLGTTTTGIAVFNENLNKPEMLGDGDKKLFPSVVRMGMDNKKPVVVGKLADDNPPKVGEFRVFDAKRLIGRRLNDDNINAIRNLFTDYDLIADQNGQAVIRLKDKKATKYRDIKPQQISAYVLKKALSIYSDKLGSTDELKAVITIPAKFNEGQRAATKEAADIAGIEILQLLAEPTAAAISYLVKEQEEPDGYYIVFDFGGGTLDVSLVEKKGIDIQVKGIEGDTLLGGRDIDNLLFEYMIEKLTELQIPMVTKPTNKPGINRKITRKRHFLMKECKLAKEVLSDYKEHDIDLETYFGDDDEDELETKITITRELLEELLSRNLIHKIMNPVKAVLSSTNINKSQLSGVLLAGGSSRIPMVRRKIAEYFGGIKIYNSKDPDWVVTEGAAIYANLLSQGKAPGIPTIVDAVPDNFGVEVVGGKMSNILTKNMPLPAMKTKNYTTVYDNQVSVRCSFFQGPNKDVINNVHLYTTTMSNIPHLPKGVPDIKISMTLDESGILQCSGICIDSDSKIETTLEIGLKGRLSGEELQILKGGDDLPSMPQNIENKVQQLLPLIMQIENKLPQLNFMEKKKHVGKLSALYSFADNINGVSETDIDNRINDAKNLLNSL